MNLQRLALGLALLELATALSYYAIYTSPFRFFGASGYWAPMSLIGHALALLFILLPALGLVGVLGRWRRTAFAALAIWPAVAFMFGVIPLPFGHLVYTSSVGVNTVIITIVDLLTIAATVWLAVAIRSRSNSTLHPDAREAPRFAGDGRARAGERGR